MCGIACSFAGSGLPATFCALESGVPCEPPLFLLAGGMTATQSPLGGGAKFRSTATSPCNTLNVSSPKLYMLHTLKQHSNRRVPKLVMKMGTRVLLRVERNDSNLDRNATLQRTVWLTVTVADWLIDDGPSSTLEQVRKLVFYQMDSLGVRNTCTNVKNLDEPCQKKSRLAKLSCIRKYCVFPRLHAYLAIRLVDF